MQAGQVLVKWDTLGVVEIKTSLGMASSENKKLAVRVLLDAAKAILETGTPLEVPLGTAGVRLLGAAG